MSAPPATALPGTRPPAPPVTTPRPPVRWVSAVGAGVAVLLAGVPVSAVVQGTSWIRYAVEVVGLVTVVGLLLGRRAAPIVVGGQLIAVAVLLTGEFSDDGVFGLLPGPGAWRDLAALVGGAGGQIETGVAPVPPTPEILLLVAAAFAVVAVLVHAVAVLAHAPAAAAVPLLAVFAVPTALADELLPWWAMAAAAVGFAVLLVVRDGVRLQLTGGAALTAGAVAVAMLAGAAAGAVGTSGRFDAGGLGGTGTGGSIGLTPFTALRGQLDQSTPAELFRVRGLPRPAYMRALTLRDFVADTGWQTGRPEPGVPLTGPLPDAGGVPGERGVVGIENVGFRDYWLPLYGTPLAVSGVAGGQWNFDRNSGIAYTGRPRAEGAWEQQTLLPTPSADQLRAAERGPDVSPAYLDTTGLDPRVTSIARSVTKDADTDFDRAIALVDHFTAPGSQFSYSLQTAPGSGDDALVEFLTIGRSGYCEQFASAMAIMLRAVGVPARVAIGFTAGQDAGDHRSVTTGDAHAWVEAWYPGVGWTIFDPTPLADGRAIVPPYVLEARASTGAGADLAPDEPSPETLPTEPALPQDATAPVAPEAGTLEPDAGAGLPLWPVALGLGLVLAGLVPAGLRERDRRRRLAAVAAGGPGAAGAGWAELLAESTDRGARTPPTDTVRGAARRLVREHRLDPDAQHALRKVVGAVEASWFGAVHPQAGHLDEPVRALRASIAANSPIGLRSRLLPRSVLDGWRDQRSAANAPTDDEAATPRS